MGPRSKPSSHYESAFESYVRGKGLPYIAVNEAKKSLFGAAKLKSFDFVVYRPDGKNLLIDVKGRKLNPAAGKRATLQNWVTREDIDDLRQWQEIFGNSFTAMFLFVFAWDADPANAPLKELFAHQEKWYGTMGVTIEDYRVGMKNRSEAWGTVHLPADYFREKAKSFEDWL